MANPVLTDVFLASAELATIVTALEAVIDYGELSRGACSSLPTSSMSDLYRRCVTALDSGAIAMTIDGGGLRIVPMSSGDRMVVIVALKGRLVDLYSQGTDELTASATLDLINRLEVKS